MNEVASVTEEKEASGQNPENGLVASAKDFFLEVSLMTKSPKKGTFSIPLYIKKACAAIKTTIPQNNARHSLYTFLRNIFVLCFRKIQVLLPFKQMQNLKTVLLYLCGAKLKG